MKKIFTIIGPTAVGKTNISIKIAKLIKGQVVGLDSRQIYKGMSIGTAQPDKIEMQSILHHLVGERDPNFIWRVPEEIWVIIVGIIALNDWRGPKLLKGLISVIGNLKVFSNDTATWSDAIFVAAYGDCAFKGCFSSIGEYKGLP